jgi:hypothetical protein|tara:strand:+ start:3365 stop:3814 length:450 start_codon:yes stop_codon:yes gene_type:complete
MILIMSCSADIPFVTGTITQAAPAPPTALVPKAESPVPPTPPEPPLRAYGQQANFPYQLVCNDSALVLNTLEQTHEEEPVTIGHAEDANGRVQSIYQNYVNRKTRTFTIVMHMIYQNKKLTCLIGSGKNFYLILPEDIRKRLEDQEPTS